MSAYTQVGADPSQGLTTGATPGQEEAISLIRNYTVAVASSLRRLVHGMADLPGRKSAVILSDSLPIRTPDDTEPLGTQSVFGNSATAPAVGSGTGGPILAGIHGIIDESVRARVVIYAIDTRSPKVAGRFSTHAAIEIPVDLAPGDYLLRVDIEDQLPPPRQTRAWQWARLTVGAAEP